MDITCIRNATPHKVVLMIPDPDHQWSDQDHWPAVEFMPSGIIARVSTTQTEDVELSQVLGVPVVKEEAGAVQGLPNEDHGTIWIVSTIVLNNSDRHDLIAPDTGPTAIRNAEGQIIGVIRFKTK